MKALQYIASAAILSLALAAPVMAERSSDKDPTVTASVEVPETKETKATNAELANEAPTVPALVLEALGEAPEFDEDESEDLTPLALRAFYAGSEAKPIWVSDGKPNEKARAAAREIGNAKLVAMDPADYPLPDMDSVASDHEALAKFELAMTQALLKFANDAKTGRIHPSDVRHTENNPEGLKDPRGFLQDLLRSDDVAAVMQGLHPQHPQFKALQKKLAELMGGTGEKPRVQIPDGPVLKAGVSHEHVALLRKRLGVEDPGGAASEEYDDAVAEAVKAFQKSKGLKQDGVVGNNTRHSLNGESNEQLKVRIITNMERWRWLPDNMARDAGIYVWANIPEYRVRIVKGEKVAFDERMIVGKTNKQTPVFSDEMEWIEIHPVWYVPMSIMVGDIQPSLRRPTSTVMERYHLRLNCGAHGTDWKKIDWNRVSIRNCSVSQPPGAKSVLGDFKFKFPNKHIVYMHDTPTKGLFNQTVRTYSHGCMRIRNPRRMAEILLETDKGMTAAQLGQILDGPKRPHKEELKTHIPVHVTYFTVFFNEKGELQTFRDVYGHDRRLAQKLTGKGDLLPAPAIAVSRMKKKEPTSRTAREWTVQNAFSRN